MKIDLHPFPPILSLSLSNTCIAKCIWCPIGRGIYKRRKNRFMPMEIVDKVIADTHGQKISEIWFSENGEGLLHPRFREIVGKLRYVFPYVGFGLGTNLACLNDELIEFILKTGFIWIGCNIDGLTQEAYGAVKGLDVERAKTNLLKLISVRNGLKLKTGIHVSVLTQPSYYMAINEPEKITVKDETIEVGVWLRQHLDWETLDSILNPFPLTWAERERWKRKREGGTCLGLPTVGKKLFLDTDGNAYGCCLDYDSSYIFGNVLENSILSVWHSEKRRSFLTNIANQDYQAIGKPCMYCRE